MPHYLDTSAVVKLVVLEPESAALRGWLTEDVRTPLSSDLVRTELLRAARRHGDGPARIAESVLETIEIQTITREIYEMAGRLSPLALRSLDAIHLACALNLGGDLESIVTYDERLAAAARSQDMAVTAPV